MAGGSEEKMKLYEIDQQIMSCIDNETGEIVDFERLNELHMERIKKIENIALAYKNCMSEAVALKAEKEAFEEREKRAKNRAEDLKKYLAYVLDGKKFKTTLVEIGFRKSEAVVVDCDVFKLPDDYLKYKMPEPDKAKIKAALKSGQNISGCRIEVKNNINIK